MGKLRVMSWNIRTMGVHEKSSDMIMRIGNIVLDNRIDIFCVQELQAGKDVPNVIGADISVSSKNSVENVRSYLESKDSGASWCWAVSGVNKGKSKKMRDAYAFFWKLYPVKSDFRHDAPVNSIELVSGPNILDVSGFPSRRPGMAMFNIKIGNFYFPVNVISYHAQTPVNNFSKGKGAGHAINFLAKLDEVGGGMYKSNGFEWIYEESVKPLPTIDTIVLGDFNFSTNVKGAEMAYCNLMKNYTPCISSLDHTVYTTYTPDPTKALGLVSAYDNIFVLKSHEHFTPKLTPNENGGTYDFILHEAEKIGNIAGIFQYGTEAAWYVVYKTLYATQYGVTGLSDHIPVWREFDIGNNYELTNDYICKTSSYQNNGLFHAIFGKNDVAGAVGTYFDAEAAEHRQQVITSLSTYSKDTPFPNLNYRDAVLRSMASWFADNVDLATILRAVVDEPAINIFEDDEFLEYYRQYVASIIHGRMMYPEEIEIIAQVFNIKVNLIAVQDDELHEKTFNEDSTNLVNIFHQNMYFNHIDIN